MYGQNHNLRLAAARMESAEQFNPASTVQMHIHNDDGWLEPHNRGNAS
jgi:hypothetical protein